MIKYEKKLTRLFSKEWINRISLEFLERNRALSFTPSGKNII